MPRGGKRPGAGRPVSKLTKLKQIVTREIASTGELPLEYMLRVMRDRTVDHERRDWAAKECAPYCHAKLSPKPEKDGEEVQRPVAKTGLEALLN